MRGGFKSASSCCEISVLRHQVAVGASAPTRAISSNVVTMTRISKRTTVERREEKIEKRKTQSQTRRRVLQASACQEERACLVVATAGVCFFQNCTCNRALRNADAFSRHVFYYLILVSFFQFLNPSNPSNPSSSFVQAIEVIERCQPACSLFRNRKSSFMQCRIVFCYLIPVHSFLILENLFFLSKLLESSFGNYFAIYLYIKHCEWDYF